MGSLQQPWNHRGLWRLLRKRCIIMCPRNHTTIFWLQLSVCVYFVFNEKHIHLLPFLQNMLTPLKINMTWNLKLIHLQRKIIYLNQTTSMTKSVPAVHFPGCSWHMSRSGNPTPQASGKSSCWPKVHLGRSCLGRRLPDSPSIMGI